MCMFIWLLQSKIQKAKYYGIEYDSSNKVSAFEMKKIFFKMKGMVHLSSIFIHMHCFVRGDSAFS